ncbi:DUF1294 domain-containing protein [Shewanella sp. Scap07]|uniref:DUF1294 domain-containing protein n=1 Tax=Shewanella sp. Scap07 TaxID=2589987 RepID=UPI0015BBC8E4|nr:DUF1294 domain-containing protein [Shewanella sp. Scap07]QLE84511.1 DUF1294 domain-containing protein [Shewanella sp. Scap07]
MNQQWCERSKMNSKVIACLLFISALLCASYLNKLPMIVTAVYLGCSIITFAVYAWDKSAARKGHWRVKERSLHLLALGCGWPGALIAQSVLRHKSQKRPFRLMLAVIVLVNLMMLGLLASPIGEPLTQALP